MSKKALENDVGQIQTHFFRKIDVALAFFCQSLEVETHEDGIHDGSGECKQEQDSIFDQHLTDLVFIDNLGKLDVGFD